MRKIRRRITRGVNRLRGTNQRRAGGMNPLLALGKPGEALTAMMLWVFNVHK